jgi:hypothetical protein
MQTIPLLTALAGLTACPSIFFAATQPHFTTIYALTGGNPLGLTAANGVLYGATYGVGPTDLDS